MNDAAQQLLHQTTQRPIAWVGGALDPSTRLLKRFVRPGQQYFRWTEQKALGRWLDAHRDQQALVIAHSYGASTAVAVIAAGHPVAELVTIDPVGWRKPKGDALRQYCQHWRNYQAADTKFNFANLVAVVGGNWRQWPAAFAHQHLKVPADHAQIVVQVLRSLRETAAAP
jgi:pimeloyl-ACP methyl ester carboxylesterase